MPIDSTKLNALLALPKPAVCEVLRVQWSPTDIRYYAISKFDEIVPFRGVKKYLDDGDSGLTEIEVKLLGKSFHDFEICADDVENDEIGFTFENQDKEISDLFNAHGDGVRCSLFYYYPESDIWFEHWFGQLHAGGRDYQALPARATNGYTPIDYEMPHGKRSVECPFTFGFHIKTVAQLEVNGCPYDRHLGGSVGTLDPDTGLPWTFCPRLAKADSIARLGTDKYFGGINWRISGYVTDPSNNYTALAMPVGENNREPVPVVAGNKYLRNLNILFFRRELNASNPERGFFRVIAEIGEGEIQSIEHIQLNDKFIELLHIQTRLGQRGQPVHSIWQTNTATSINNMSGRATLSAAYGWVNPGGVTAQSITSAARVFGYNKVAVFTDESTYSRIWCDERAFWLLEMYTNPRFGKGIAHDKFDIQSFIDVAIWHREYIRFTHPDPDASTQYFDYRRDKFDALITPKPSSAVIEEMCLAGRMSVPFQHEGQYTVAALRKQTTDELNNAKVFTDTGQDKNIVVEEINGVKMPSLRIIQTPNEELVNEIQLTFEDGDNLDNPRPITGDDPNQQRVAGGGNERKVVPKQYYAFGIQPLNIAMKLLYGLLWFGKFDEGGIKNNCRITFKAWHIHVLNLKKYDVIKIVSNELTGYGYTNPVTEEFYQFEYFRIMNMRKVSGNQVEITAQAYNHAAYTTFETSASAPEGFPPENELPNIARQARPSNPDVSAAYENGNVSITLD